MVVFQKNAVGDDRYRIVDLLVEYVRERGGTYRGMRTRYTTVRSFFLHSRAELPRVPVRFTPTRDAAVGRLNLDVLRVLVQAAGLRNRAIYLTLFQGLMDQKRFTEFNRRGFELAEHVRRVGVETPFRVDFLRGRKGNARPFNTWIGRDALEAWRLYFDRERGWPNPGEAAALDGDGKPLGRVALRASHRYLLRKLRFVTGYGDKSTRYGYNLHELRDLARSILEKARADGFNPQSAEYWMGHTVDPLYYNKVWKLDPEYNLAQYRIAEKYLSLSGRPSADADALIESILRDKKTFDRLVEALGEKMGLALAPPIVGARKTWFKRR
jgi:hypothetical protein